VNREIVMAVVCAAITVAIAWLVDHPDKVAGTLILLVALGILVAVARNRAPERSRRGANPTRRNRRNTR
jgi:hypothetical protein